MKKEIELLIKESIEVKVRILSAGGLLNTISKAEYAIASALRDEKKVLFCGNGGSASDAQHLAAELSGRFYKDRPALYADALHCNSSYLTAVANDYSFNDIYARLIHGIAQPGDVLVALSTSGNSENIIRAIKAARDKEMVIIGLTGKSGGEMAGLCHYLINVPSEDTPRIQEAHILIGHIICEGVEADLFPEPVEEYFYNRTYFHT